MHFKSDNTVKIHPKILEAIANANQDFEPSYGNDKYTLKLKDRFSEIFETEVSIFLVTTGTAANSLALSALVPPYGAIYCHDHAHINTDEAGAPELFTSSAKLIPSPGQNGKISVDAIKQQIESAHVLRPHMSKPGCLSISQATECGTIYSLAELKEISDLAKFYNLPIHMDGARFANSLATFGERVSPAEATWKSGIDVLSFGATKNGAMAAEAIVFFNQKYTQNFDYRHKRGGQLLSKMRFFSSQFLAYFEDNLWLNNAAHANAKATQLAQIFNSFHITPEYPVEANEVFVRLPLDLASFLYKNGGGFYEWGAPGCGLYRFVTSCFTVDEDLKTLEQFLQQYFRERL